MPGDRRVQQSVPGSEPEGRTVLRDEGDAEELHFVEPEAEYNSEREGHLHYAEPPLHREAEALLRDAQLRVLCDGL